MVAIGFLILASVLLCTVFMDIAHNRYKALWREANRLLGATDEERERYHDKMIQYQHEAATKAVELKALRKQAKVRDAAFEDLERGFLELYQLGVDLVAEREHLPRPLTFEQLQQQIRNATAAETAAAAQSARANVAYDQAIHKLIEEGGKGAAHTPGR